MTYLRFTALLGLPFLLAALGVGADEPPKPRTPKEALQLVQPLIGSWRGTGLPEGTREDKQKGLWVETISWEWQFKEKDVFLKAAFDKGKYFTTAELRYLPEKNVYQLTALTPSREKLVFTGALEDKRLTLERTDEQSKETQRLVFSLLHENRHVYKYEVKPVEKPAFKTVYQVGATKEGVPFATTDTSTDCIVSGGKGTMTVTYEGKTYYVCCSGCKDAFNADPAKYVKEQKK